jgi:hypothetical protein
MKKLLIFLGILFLCASIAFAGRWMDKSEDASPTGTDTIMTYDGSATRTATIASVLALADSGTDDQTAAEVPFTPDGNIASTNVQDAIVEVRDEASGGSGDAQTTDPLSQFASTTSSQFAGVISNETGSGLVVLATSPVLVTPNLGVPTAVDITAATGTISVDIVLDTATNTTSGEITYNSGKIQVGNGSTVDYFSNDALVEVTISSGTSALGTSSISSGACATTVTTTATGVATTDVINWGFNGDPTSTTGYAPTINGMLTIIAWPSSNNVNYDVCNLTGSAITPGAITLNWRISR